MRKFVIGIVLLVAAAAGATGEERPAWAKKATAFPAECGETVDFKRCTPLQISSPDNKARVEVSYERDSDQVSASLRLTTPGRGTREVGAPCSNGDLELLWAPNSKAFFINGGCGQTNTGLVVYVYFINSAQGEGLDLTREAQLDMLKSFPLCNANNHDLEGCKVMQADPENYNMSGIDWLEDSTGIVVISEVPCRSRYNGVVCPVMGYELGVPSGKILKRMNAKDFKTEWQSSMAWEFKISEPPDYKQK